MSLMLNTGAMSYREDGSSGWTPLTLVANVDLASLADEFSTSSTYEVGEYVRHNSRMYRCTTAVTTAGAWNASNWTEVNIGDELESIKTSLNNAILQSAAFAITANGTTSHSLTGLTADHVVGNWGMFTDSGLTTPIPENAPTADITITTSSGSWSITVANFTSTFYIAPTFIKD